MRPLEVVLLIMSGAAFLTLIKPRLRASRWTSTLVPLAPATAAAQAALEGPRWQMVPAYVVSGLLFVAWLIRCRPLGRFAMTVAAVVGALGLLLSVALPTVLPVFSFPPPSGPYPIGTLTYHWIDAARPDVFIPNTDQLRELIIQVWYPARASASSVRAPYLDNPAELAPVEHLLHLPDFLFDHFKYVATHATPSAPAADDVHTFPVLIFVSGRGGYRQSNTFQVEELVSHGYIVVGLDQPYASAGVVFPDGRMVAMDPRLYDPARPGHALFLDSVLPFLTQDVSFTLDQLARLNLADPSDILTGRIDLSRAGIFGVSLGGILAGEACLREPRLRACLVMDAFMPANVVEMGLPEPTMWLSRDRRSMQLEGWTQSDIDETQTSMRAVYERLARDSYLVLVPGLFHNDFTDAPLFSPVGSLLGLSGSLDERRAHGIINAYSLAFFDQYLQHKPSTLLQGTSADYPEVLFESRR